MGRFWASWASCSVWPDFRQILRGLRRVRPRDRDHWPRSTLAHNTYGVVSVAYSDQCVVPWPAFVGNVAGIGPNPTWAAQTDPMLKFAANWRVLLLGK